MDVVAHCGSEIFVMENVPQLLNSDEHKQIVETAEALGFKTASAKLCAADYGVPQIRWRAFIAGCKFTDPGFFFPPRKTHKKTASSPSRDLFDDNGIKSINAVKPWKSVRDAIGDLPPPVGTAIRSSRPPMDLHFGRTPTAMSLARYRAIPHEGMNRFDLQKAALDITPACWVRKTKGGTDLFGRLWWDRPAFTIRTEFFKPEKGRYLHPEQHRPITHREAARLQTFPDSFRFKGTKIEIAKQIGNAVPPLLAARIADSVLSMLALKVNTYDGQVFASREKQDHVLHKRLEYNY